MGGGSELKKKNCMSFNLHAQQFKLFINRRSIETTQKISIFGNVTLQSQSPTAKQFMGIHQQDIIEPVGDRYKVHKLLSA